MQAPGLDLDHSDAEDLQAPAPSEETHRPVADPYYDWRAVHPQLQTLIDNYDVILREMEALSEVLSSLFQLCSILAPNHSPVSVCLSSIFLVDRMAREPLYRRRAIRLDGISFSSYFPLIR